jgi:hypothetical protein
MNSFTNKAEALRKHNQRINQIQKEKEMNRNGYNELNAFCDAIPADTHWFPVWADVIDRHGNNVGTLVVSYPTVTPRHFDFMPTDQIAEAWRGNYETKRAEQLASGKKYHRRVRHELLENVVPKWVGRHTLTNFRDISSETS